MPHPLVKFIKPAPTTEDIVCILPDALGVAYLLCSVYIKQLRRYAEPLGEYTVTIFPLGEDDENPELKPMRDCPLLIVEAAPRDGGLHFLTLRSLPLGPLVFGLDPLAQSLSS